MNLQSKFFVLVIVLNSPVTFAVSSEVDSYIQAPLLESPRQQGIAGEYARYSISNTSLARASFNVPLALDLDQKAGALGAAFLPTYNPEGGLSEWGMGWNSTLEIKRINLFTEVNYQSDHLASPFGRLVPGNNGLWYSSDAQIQVEAKLDADTITVRDGKGARYIFGGSNIVPGRIDQEVYAWYLTKIIDQFGDETIFTYTKNASERFFLDTVQYGGRGAKFAYKIKLNFQGLDAARQLTSYESGRAKILDQRVASLALYSGETLQKRYEYRFSYRDSKLGPSFYLMSVQKVFASGAEEPAKTYSYDDIDQFLANASSDFVQKLEPIMQGLGNQILSPRNISIIDYNDDGLSDFEVPSVNKIFVQKTDGFDQVDVSPAADADLACVNDTTGIKGPRNINRILGYDDVYHVFSKTSEQGASQTRIKVCNLKAQLEYSQVFNGAFYSQSLARLADLNRDGKPDLIALQGGKLRILENTSQGTINFTELGPQTLDSSEYLKVAWVADVNGDGIADIIGKNNVGVYVYFGSGGFQFAKTPRIMKLNSQTGEALDPNNYALSPLDINNDGMLDLVLSQGHRVYLFINSGRDFYTTDMPALAGRDDMSGYPVMARFTERGPFQLITPDGRGRALNIALSRPELGMLTDFSDGKGNRVAFKYAFTKPEVNMRWQRPLLIKKQSSISGKGDIEQNFSYSSPIQHSKLKAFIAFAKVESRSKPENVKYQFVANDNFEVLETRRDTHDVLSGLTSISLLSYVPKDLHGIPLNIHAQAIERMSDSSGNETTLKQINLAGFNDFGCAAKSTTVTKFGKLHIRKLFFDDGLFEGGLGCLTRDEVIQGEHPAHPNFDFKYRKVTQFTDVGLPSKVQFGAENSLETLASYTYDSLNRLTTLDSVNEGRTKLGYFSDSRVLNSQIQANGLTKIANIDPVSFLSTSTSIDRGNDVKQIDFFAFDEQERFARSWSNQYGTENEPTNIITYTYAEANKPALIRTQIRQSANAVSETLSMFASDGDQIGELSKGDGVWKVKNLVRKDLNAGLSEELRRSPFSEVDLLGSFGDIYASAEVAKTTLASSVGRVVKSLQRIDDQTGKTQKYEYQVKDAAIEVSEVTNGHHKRISRLVPDLGLASFSDELANTTEYHRDVLGRLRILRFPSGKATQRTFDAMARETSITFEGVGSIKKSYDQASRRMARQEFFDSNGALTSSLEFAYDSALRVVAKTFKSHAEEQKFNFQYDGAGLSAEDAKGQKGFLSVVEGPDYRRDMIYDARAKLARERVRIANQASFLTAFRYNSDGSLLSQNVSSSGSTISSQSYTKTFLYNNNAHMSGLKVGANTVFNIELDDANEAKRLEFANTSYWERSLDPISRLPKSFSAQSTNFDYKLTLGYNDRSLLSQQSLAIGTQLHSNGYAYDERGFMVGEITQNSHDAYDYNQDGELSILRNHTVSKSNGLFKVGNVEHKLDAWGRLIESLGFKYTYGANNRIKIAETATGKYHLIYDENGKRVGIQKLNDVVAAFASGLTFRNASLYENVKIGQQHLGVLKNGNFNLVAASMNGSFLADQGSANTQDAYGLRKDLDEELLASLDFGGHRRDAEIGLIDMGARDYSAATATFTSPDFYFFENFEELSNRPAEANLFSYAANDPINYIDPSGKYGIFVLNPNAVQGSGHAGVVIGNQDIGFHFFEMAMPPDVNLWGKVFGAFGDAVDVPGYTVNALIGNKDAFFQVVSSTTLENLTSNLLAPNGFEMGLVYNSTPEQDQMMLDKAISIAASGRNYSLLTYNCGHFVKEVLEAGGVKSPSSLSIKPNSMFNDYSKHKQSQK